MTVFFYSMKRIFRNKVQILVMLILPFLPLIPVAFGDSQSEFQFRVAVVDADHTELTASLVKNLRTGFKITSTSQDKLERGLAASEYDYALVIEKGLTDRIIQGEDASIRGIGKKEMDISKMVGAYIDSYITQVKTIAKAANRNSSKFYEYMSNFENGNMVIKSEYVRKSNQNDTRVAWGMIVMFSMFSTTFAATQLITDKERGTLFRSLSSPMGIKNYMLQNILSFLIVSAIQITVLVTGSILLLGIDPGGSAINMYLLLLVFMLVSVSFGIAVSSITRTSIQAISIGVGLSAAMSMLGGAWGGELSTGIVKNIGMLTPVSWVMEGVIKLLNNSPLSSVTTEIAVLLLFSLVFFLLGTWRKSDIAK